MLALSGQGTSGPPPRRGQKNISAWNLRAVRPNGGLEHLCPARNVSAVQVSCHLQPVFTTLRLSKAVGLPYTAGQKCLCSQWRRLEVQDQGVTGFAPSQPTLSRLVPAVHCLRARVVSPRVTCDSGLCSLDTSRVVRGHSHHLILIEVTPLKGLLFLRSSIYDFGGRHNSAPNPGLPLENILTGFCVEGLWATWGSQVC